MPSSARAAARQCLSRGAACAYDRFEIGSIRPARDWAHRAARGVLADLTDRRTVKWGFTDVDEDVRVEIVDAIAEIIREAARAARKPKGKTRG